MKKLIAPALLAGFVFGLLAVMSSAAPGFPQEKEKKDVKQPAAKIFIPKEVRDVMLQGLQARQTRPDIPFTIFKSAFLPARDAFYIIPFLKIKNADLPFMPAAAAQIADAAVAPVQPKLRAVFDVFLQFHKMDNGVPTQIAKEVYIPVTLEEDTAAYDPNKEEWYSVAYPLLPGNYLLAIAVTTHDLKKIGMQYFEFSLPDLKSYTKEMDTTPVFFLKNYKELPAAETVAQLHKGCFRYSIAQFSPSIDNTFAVGDSLEVFFFALGAQPNDQNKYDIECQYDVKQGDKEAIIFAPAKYETPFISQPLFLKQTLQIKKTDNNAKLLLSGWSWSKTQSGNSIEAKGDVKNISTASLKNVEAVVTFSDKDNNKISQASVLIDANPILANQSSTFKITGDFNPAISNATVEFKVQNGEKIVNSEERQESRDLPPGSYTFTIKLTDKVSSRTCSKTVDLTVK